jgi:hypothetical protein
MSNMLLLNEAERAINQILAKLEADTGQIVDEIALEDIEITNIGSPRHELNRRVVLTLKRLPGTLWAGAK